MHKETAVKKNHVFLQVTLKECDAFDLRVLKGPSDYMAAATNTETTEKIEACMKVWIKQIEQVRRDCILLQRKLHICFVIPPFVVRCSLLLKLVICELKHFREPANA